MTGGTETTALEYRSEPRQRERRTPSIGRVAAARAGIELRSYFRNRQAVVFTFALPLVLLLIFGAIYSGNAPGTHTPMKQVLIAGIIASGIMSTTFSSLAVAIAVERDDGTLRRLAATPMSPVSYFLGKVVQAFVIGVLETVVLLAVGVGLFGLHLPDTGARWFTFVWVVVLGIVACSFLGIAYSRVAPNARAAAPVVQLPYLGLQLISGVFFVFTSLPGFMQVIAGCFPLKWMAQGLRSAFLSDSFQQSEAAGSWEHGRTALVLGGWCLAGLLLSLATFKWGRARK
ncbi:ABC transporter permease [Streptomyces sp. NBC_00448]|uniref:ABC transporter permease n=1 Tax=Streptomyces sp. NBC_00448 TaxID=2903652 RepID=UPI002E1EC531